MQSPTGGSIVFVGVGLLVVVGLRVVVVLGGLGVRVLRGVVLGVVVSSVVVVVSSVVVVVSSVVVVLSSVVIVVSSVVVVVGAGEGVVSTGGTIGGTVGAGGPMGPSGPRPPEGPVAPCGPSPPGRPGGGWVPVSRAAPPPSPQHQVPFLRIDNIINYGLARHCTVHRPTLTGSTQALYRHSNFYNYAAECPQRYSYISATPIQTRGIIVTQPQRRLYMGFLLVFSAPTAHPSN